MAAKRDPQVWRRGANYWVVVDPCTVGCVPGPQAVQVCRPWPLGRTRAAGRSLRRSAGRSQRRCPGRPERHKISGTAEQLIKELGGFVPQVREHLVRKPRTSYRIINYHARADAGRPLRRSLNRHLRRGAMPNVRLAQQRPCRSPAPASAWRSGRRRATSGARVVVPRALSSARRATCGVRCGESKRLR
jgi:hypothetical protein